MEALSADDVCDGEQCSLSLRQLRGMQSESPVTEHNATANGTAPAANITANSTEVAEAVSSGSNGTAAESTAADEEPETEETEEEEVPSTADTVQIYVPDPSETIEDSGEDDVGEPISRINETLKQQEREDEEGGTCCFSGEDSKDTCGTCYPMSIASYKSKCSRKNYCLDLRLANL